MSLDPMQQDAVYFFACSIFYDKQTNKPKSDQKIQKLNIPEKLLKRKIDISPSYKFETKDGFAIPLTPVQLAKYETEIEEKRKKLKVYKNIRIREAALQNLSTPKPIKPINKMSSQEVELMYQMMENQQKQMLQPPDPEKERLARQKLEKLKHRAIKLSTQV